MLEFRIDVVGPADRLLYEGLPVLQPALQRLDEGALLIGGLAVAAWMSARPVEYAARATRDVDLGIDRTHLAIKRGQAIVGPLLRALEFRGGYNDEDFRFARETAAGTFIVDCLVAKGASREQPPVVEAGMPSLAAPGLAYAFRRGAVPLRIVLHGEQERAIAMHTVTLDAAFVMKGGLHRKRTAGTRGPSHDRHRGCGAAGSCGRERPPGDSGARRQPPTRRGEGGFAMDLGEIRLPPLGHVPPRLRPLPRRRRGRLGG